METLQRGVRVVLLNEQGQVLLLQRPRFDGTPCWTTPGCALQEGETFDGAASRYLRQRLGRNVLPRRAWVSSAASSSASLMGGRLLFQEEQFFLATVTRFTCSVDELRRCFVADEPLAVRWWSLEELEHPKGTLHLQPRNLTADLRRWQEEMGEQEAAELGEIFGTPAAAALR